MKALEQRVENLVARKVALIVIMSGDYSAMVDQHGAVDAEKVAEYARELVRWRPGVAKGARVPTPSFGQGRRAAVD